MWQKKFGRVATVVALVVSACAIEPVYNCRDRSNNLRQDGGLCFEIPPWQHKPVELEEHLQRCRVKFDLKTYVRVDQHADRTRKIGRQVLVNSAISRYMDTVIAPFLDTYHQNIQSSHQQMTGKILKKIKEEINAAILKKNKIYTELMNLVDELRVPEMCEEERRAARTLASKHVARIYACTEEARASLAKMGKYAEEMINITRTQMQITLDGTSKIAESEQHDYTSKKNSTSALLELSNEAVSLGYELDLSLTNARRHNEQSCEKLTTCCARSRTLTEQDVKELKEQLHQCVYA